MSSKRNYTCYSSNLQARVQPSGSWGFPTGLEYITCIAIVLDMHPLAVASRSRLLEREPKLFVFETSYYAFCGRYCFFDSSARTVFTERWRHLTYSNEPNFINNVLFVAKEYFHFKLSNVTKRANCYGIVLFPRV